MMYALLTTITLIFLNKVLYSMLYTFIEDNFFSRNLYIANILIQLIMAILLLYFFRSRKWPDFFSVDMQYQLLEDNAGSNAKPPVMANSLSQEWLMNHKNGNEVVREGTEMSRDQIERYELPPLTTIVNVTELEGKD